MIATDGQRTFALFIYGDIEWGDDATIGFNAGDGVRSIVVTTRPLDVETGSNVGVTGLYIYTLQKYFVKMTTSAWLLQFQG